MNKISISIAVFFISILLVGCGDMPWQGEGNSCGQQRATPRPMDYEVVGNCGWSYELGCRVCEVRYRDGKRGAKCL